MTALRARGWRLAIAPIVLCSALLGAAVARAAATDGPVRAAADGEQGLERKVKAAFLYNFIAYVEWPPEVFEQPDSPVVVGVAGTDEAVDEVREVIGGRSAKGRPVIVRRLRDGDPLAGVHIAFVTMAERTRIAALARSAAGTGTLVVTESESALAQGSMINFRLLEGRVRFDVDLGSVSRAGLRISSRMLAVAQSVLPAP